ncbi:MAG: gp33 family protein [Planctomycetota bacterium]|jgi:hypothetical protein
MDEKKDTLAPVDFSAFESEVDDTDVLGKISNLANELKKKNQEIAEAEITLKRLKNQQREIQEERLPALFESVGWAVGAKIQTGDGTPLVFEEVIHTSIAGAKKPAAIQWLDDNNHGGIVSRNVVIGFNKCDEKKVAKLLRLIGKGWPNHKTELDVNGASVKALVKRLMKEGVDVPLETFGVHQANVVKISSK